MGCFRFAPEDQDELQAWGAIAVPAGVTTLLVLLMDFTDQAMIGHYEHGNLLPAASSAVLVIELTSALFLRGPSAAVSTLSANAYGAGQQELAGRRLQLGLVFAVVLSVCIAPVWWFCGDLLWAVTHTTLDRNKVNKFGRWRVIGLVPNAIFSLLACWLQGRKVTVPAMRAAFVGFVLNLVLNIALIYGCLGWGGLGFIGSPIATAICRWVMMLTLAFSCRSEVAACWPCTWRPTFAKRRVGDFVKLWVPLTFTALLEEFNLEITGVLALHFGPQELATHNCMLTTFVLLSTVMDACATGTRTRVTHHVVVGDVAAMRRSVRLASRVMMSWSFVVTVAFCVLQDRIGMFVSPNDEVWRLSGQIAFLVGPLYIMMTLFYISMAVLEGLARPGAIMVGFILGCYFVGLPLTIVFGFEVPPKAFSWWPYFDPKTASGDARQGCGILGLWMGLSAGYLITTAVASGRLACIKDWVHEVARAREIAEVTETLLDESTSTSGARTPACRGSGGEIEAHRSV